MARHAPFIGRELELNKLSLLTQKKTASFVIIRGRRRIGKSRLAEEFGKQFEKFYRFSGLPPEKNITAKDQLKEFCKQLADNFKSPFAQYSDWHDAFLALAEKVKTGRILLLFDEISWMGNKSKNFFGLLKNLWDLHLKQNPSLIFIICGSASAWIEKNIINNTGFVGRISFTLTLNELPLDACSHFWPENISAYEKLKVLSITGGVPQYLEEINFRKTAEENIKNLCFTDGGLLVDEFDKIFTSTLLRKSTWYKKILHILARGAKEHNEIQKELGLSSAGRLYEYLWELEIAGFIARDYTWNIITNKDIKLSKYRLRDNYTRFYLKYIEESRSKIYRNSYDFKSLFSLPEWNSIMGLQFENLVLNNRRIIQKQLGIYPEDILCENPYFQKPSSKQKGCQIDYMIKTKFNTLYVCEIKFSKNPVDTNVISSIQAKIDALKFHRRFSCRPVLIHINGVTNDINESDFFSKIIDFGELLYNNAKNDGS
jgi:uncharacterized protein